MPTPLENQAIQAALETDWEKAITLNKEILKEDKGNLEAWNRLGRAYSETAQLERARSSYREVLRHDPYNSIALKNLERLKAANGRSGKLTGGAALSPDLFLESPGKTKVLGLENLAKPEILAVLHTGDQVKIESGKDFLRLEDASGLKIGEYHGELADKLAVMVRGGNVYEAYVKSVKPQELKIFVREVKRAPKFAGTPSFPTVLSSFKPYVHEGAAETLASENHELVEVEGEMVEESPTPQPTKKAPSVETLENETEED